MKGLEDDPQSKQSPQSLLGVQTDNNMNVWGKYRVFQACIVFTGKVNNNSADTMEPTGCFGVQHVSLLGYECFIPTSSHVLRARQGDQRRAGVGLAVLTAFKYRPVF